MKEEFLMDSAHSLNIYIQSRALKRKKFTGKQNGGEKLFKDIMKNKAKTA